VPVQQAPGAPLLPPTTLFAKTHRRKPQGRNKTQCVEPSLLTLQNPHTHTTYARTLTNQHCSHWQRRRNDATELAHADMTTLPKVDTNCTTPSLIPTVTGNTVRSFSTHGQQPAAKGSSTTVSRSDIRLIQHLDSSAQWLGPEVALNWPFPYPLLTPPSPVVESTPTAPHCL
jgi:hypothetical protein